MSLYASPTIPNHSHPITPIAVPLFFHPSPNKPPTYAFTLLKEL